MFIHICKHSAKSFVTKRYHLDSDCVKEKTAKLYFFRLENTFNKTYIVFLSNQEIEQGQF